MSLFLAFLQAVKSPKFWGWTFSSTVLSQVVLGRPTGFLYSAAAAASFSQNLICLPPFINFNVCSISFTDGF